MMPFTGEMLLRLTISNEEDHVLCLSGVWLNINGREKCLSGFGVPEVCMQLTLSVAREINTKI